MRYPSCCDVYESNKGGFESDDACASSLFIPPANPGAPETVNLVESQGGRLMKTSRYLIVLTCFLIFSAATSTLFAADTTPFPADLKILSPDNTAVPKKLTEFSGIWEGMWEFLYGGQVNVALAVVRLTKDQADVIYSWGILETDSRRVGTTSDPGWARIPGCPVEKADDGNYVITVNLPKGGSLKLKQTYKKDLINVTRSGLGGQTAAQTMPFTKKK